MHVHLGLGRERLGVGKDQGHVRVDLLRARVHPALAYVGLHGAQVHRSLDDFRVRGQVQRDVVHGFVERVRPLVRHELLQRGEALPVHHLELALRGDGRERRGVPQRRRAAVPGDAARRALANASTREMRLSANLSGGGFFLGELGVVTEVIPAPGRLHRLRGDALDGAGQLGELALGAEPLLALLVPPRGELRGVELLRVLVSRALLFSPRALLLQPRRRLGLRAVDHGAHHRVVLGVERERRALRGGRRRRAL